MGFGRTWCWLAAGFGRRDFGVELRESGRIAFENRILKSEVLEAAEVLGEDRVRGVCQPVDHPIPSAFGVDQLVGL